MSIFAPNCLDDFLFSNASEKLMLEYILARKLPFPFNGKSGILLHGYWGTGKSTLALLLPHLLETVYADKSKIPTNVGLMTATEEATPEIFRCGGGLSITNIVNTINQCNVRSAFHHHSRSDYYILDEVDKLTNGAQQSLKSTMDLPRSFFIYTTNYLTKVDTGIINRCHLVEMNQSTNPAHYVGIGQNILRKMSLPSTAISIKSLTDMAAKAKGSLRDFATDVMLSGLSVGGVIPSTN